MTDLTLNQRLVKAYWDLGTALLGTKIAFSEAIKSAAEFNEACAHAEFILKQTWRERLRRTIEIWVRRKFSCKTCADHSRAYLCNVHCPDCGRIVAYEIILSLDKSRYKEIEMI